MRAVNHVILNIFATVYLGMIIILFQNFSANIGRILWNIKMLSFICLKYYIWKIWLCLNIQMCWFVQLAQCYILQEDIETTWYLPLNVFIQSKYMITFIEILNPQSHRLRLHCFFKHLELVIMTVLLSVVLLRVCSDKWMDILYRVR